MNKNINFLKSVFNIKCFFSLLLFILILNFNTYCNFTFSRVWQGSQMFLTTYTFNGFNYSAVQNIKSMTVTTSGTNYIINYDIDMEVKDLIINSNNSKYAGNLVFSDTPNLNITGSRCQYKWVDVANNETGNVDSYINFSNGKSGRAKYTTNSKGTIVGTDYIQNVNINFCCANLPLELEKYKSDSLKYAFKNAKYDSYSGRNTYPVNISCQTSYIGDGYWAYNYKGKITISQTQIENYKYMKLMSPEAYMYSSNSVKVDNTSYPYDTYSYYYSVQSGDINIKDVINQSLCEHEWRIINTGNRKNHKVYCPKCNLCKYEPHILEYEYDGIENNACKCLFIDKVNYTFEINDDENTIVTQTYNSYSNYDKTEYTNKVGYKFKYYEKWEKQFENMHNPLLDISNTSIKNVYIATCSNMDVKTATFSTIYKAKYNPHKYTFIFNKENNKGINLNWNIFSDSTSDPNKQVFTYNEPQTVLSAGDVEGFIWQGWSFDSESDEIDFEKGQEIFNYTEDDDITYNLYPVYKRIDFTINYVTGIGHFINNKKQLSKNYSFFDWSSLEPIYDYKGGNNTYFVCFSDQFGNKINSMSDIKNNIERYNSNNYIINLVAKFDHPSVGTAEHGAGGDAPGGNNKYDGDNFHSLPFSEDNSINEEAKIESDIQDIPKQYIYTDTLIDNKIIEEIVNDIDKINDVEIFGLTETQKFYSKYGLYVSAKKDYNKSYYKYVIKKMSKFQILMYKLNNYKILLIGLLLLGIIFLLLYIRKEKYEKKE